MLSEDDFADLRSTLVHIHDRTIKVDGGRIGLANPALLDMAVHRPWTTAFQQEKFVTPFEKAAAIGHSIAHNHPFADGNKRTAAVAISIILMLFDFRLANDTDRRVAMLTSVAAGTMDVAEVAAYVSQHAVPI